MPNQPTACPRYAFTFRNCIYAIPNNARNAKSAIAHGFHIPGIPLLNQYAKTIAQ